MQLHTEQQHLRRNWKLTGLYHIPFHLWQIFSNFIYIYVCVCVYIYKYAKWHSLSTYYS